MSDIIKLDISKELEMLNKELVEHEELYSEIKDHYDNVKASRGSGTLGFIQKQTESLVSIKSGKLSIIQQIINTKKVDVEIQLKVASANKGGNEGDEVITSE